MGYGGLPGTMLCSAVKSCVGLKSSAPMGRGVSGCKTWQ